MRRCWDENMSQRGWASRPPVEQSRRMRTTHGYVRRGRGGQYVAVLFGLQLPLTHNPFNKVRGIFFLKKFSLIFIIASICILHESAYDYTTICPPVFFGVSCQTQELTWNFELHPLFNTSLTLILFTITMYKY